MTVSMLQINTRSTETKTVSRPRNNDKRSEAKAAVSLGIKILFKAYNVVQWDEYNME